MIENNIIYDLQFGFRKNSSTAHALINLTENIRQAVDEGYIGCGIFVDLQKALTLFIMKFFDQNLIIMVSVVFQLTGLDLILLIVSSIFL